MRNRDYKNPDMNINDDYIELLDRSERGGRVAPDEYEDISSSSGDIYIGARTRERKSDSDIYITPSAGNFRNVPVRGNVDDGTRIYNGSVGGNPRQASSPPTQYKEYVPAVTNRQSKFDTQSLGDDVSDHDARKHKRRKGKWFALAFVAVFLSVVIGVAGYIGSIVNGIVGGFQQADEIEHIEDVDSLLREDHVRNILLIGADADKGGSSRSDSIILLSVNKENGRITVCSILRDTHVEIPGECEAKINSAYSWGGANLLVQTIEQNFGIYIDDYASVDFEMFVELIDALGGIEVEVTEEEADYINNQHKYGSEEKPDEVMSGANVHLDGYQALWYSRIRKLGNGDWDRTERQRKVIGAIVESVKVMAENGNISELVEIANDVAPYITTTLSSDDFQSVILSLVSCLAESGGDMDKLFISQQIPFDDTWHYSNEWDGSSISLDLEENRELLEELLYDGE